MSLLLFFQGSTCGPPTPPYGSSIIHPPKQENYNDGSVVLFGCKQGFYLVGPPIVTCSGNTWTEIKFRCLGIMPFCNIRIVFYRFKFISLFCLWGKGMVESITLLVPLKLYSVNYS